MIVSLLLRCGSASCDLALAVKVVPTECDLELAVEELQGEETNTKTKEAGSSSKI